MEWDRAGCVRGQHRLAQKPYKRGEVLPFLHSSLTATECQLCAVPATLARGLAFWTHNIIWFGCLQGTPSGPMSAVVLARHPTHLVALSLSSTTTCSMPQLPGPSVLPSCQICAGGKRHQTLVQVPF